MDGGGDGYRAPAGGSRGGGRVGLGSGAGRLPPRLPRAPGLLRPARVRGSAVYGPGFYPYYGYPYPYPYYDYPPPVVVTPPPTEYVQRAPDAGYWYYCQDPAGYYPTVAACPGGWLQVAPRSE
jgi:hypothetical protein